MKLFNAICSCCLLSLPLAGHAASSNDLIVKFCRDNMGKKVGNGQCTEVARYAIRSAGAQSRQKNADFPAKGDYVWGKFIACLETTGRGRLKESGNRKDIQAGDIIQFRDVTMKGKKPIGRGYYTRSMKHHTAVVSEVQHRGRVFEGASSKHQGAEARRGTLPQPR